MATAPFRSHLMQQFAAAARTQSRPPLALFSFGGTSSSDGEEPGRGYRHLSERAASGTSRHAPTTASSIATNQSVAPANCSSLLHHRASSSFAKSSSDAEAKPSSDDDGAPTDSSVHHQPSPSTQNLQQLITSRRTVSNFTTRPATQATSDRDFLRDAISRGVECAIAAPNHKITEPTTFHRILAPSAASERLLDVAYEVTLRRLLDGKLSGEEACRSEAARKREKWASIPAFVVATVNGMEDQTNSVVDGDLYYKELPFVPPTTTRQLEDYASACASVQNLLLSLFAEGLGTKWATGPVVRTPAFRDLVGCEQNDMVVALIMIGWPKRLPRMRRRRDLDDVLKDLE